MCAQSARTPHNYNLHCYSFVMVMLPAWTISTSAARYAVMVRVDVGSSPPVGAARLGQVLDEVGSVPGPVVVFVDDVYGGSASAEHSTVVLRPDAATSSVISISGGLK
jgi:hypothetical protein